MNAYEYSMDFECKNQIVMLFFAPYLEIKMKGFYIHFKDTHVRSL